MTVGLGMVHFSPLCFLYGRGATRSVVDDSIQYAVEIPGPSPILCIHCRGNFFSMPHLLDQHLQRLLYVKASHRVLQFFSCCVRAGDVQVAPWLLFKTWNSTLN